MSGFPFIQVMCPFCLPMRALWKHAPAMRGPLGALFCQERSGSGEGKEIVMMREELVRDVLLQGM